MKRSDNYLIKPIGLTDIGTLQQLSIDTFTETYAAFNTAENMRLHIAEKFSREGLLQEFNDERNYFFIAMHKDAPAGYIKLRTTHQPSELGNKKTIELERIYVLSNFQGIGLGYELIEKSVEVSLKNGYEILWLGVWKQNTKAVNFYMKCGFEIFGEQIFTLGADPQTDWLMKKELKHS